MITGPKSMSVTNSQGIRAPVARNWVSLSNQKRAKAVQDQAIRQSTKFAELKWNSLTGSDIIVPGNINKTTTGTYAPRNVFDMTTGLTPTYDVSFTPAFISSSQIAVSTNKDSIIWNGISQQVEVSGTVVVSTVDIIPRTVRVQIYVDGSAIDSTKASVSRISRFGTSTNTTLITVKQQLNIVLGQTVKLFVDRLDDEDDNVNCKFYDATLSVKSVTIS